MVGESGKVLMVAAAFVLERETKGTWRYREVDGAGRMLDVNAARMGVVYIRKSAIPNQPLKIISIEITTPEAS
jgi:hypothetical protein